jgi:hypothetical protein
MKVNNWSNKAEFDTGIAPVNSVHLSKFVLSFLYPHVFVTFNLDCNYCRIAPKLTTVKSVSELFPFCP